MEVSGRAPASGPLPENGSHVFANTMLGRSGARRRRGLGGRMRRAAGGAASSCRGGAARRGQVLGGDGKHPMESARDRPADAAPARERAGSVEPGPQLSLDRAIPRGARRGAWQGGLDASIAERGGGWRLGRGAERFLSARRGGARESSRRRSRG